MIQSLQQLAHLFGACAEERGITSFAVDSRQVEGGALFLALKGERTDGHLFLGDAAAKGAVAAVVAADYTGDDFGLELLRVPNVLQALQGAAARKEKGRVVAITGSLGKTTTKEFTRTLLAERFDVFASPGNRNSQVGLPLSILEAEGEVLVLEMGMTKSGQIARLVEIAPPEVAAVTAVDYVHAENFDSLEELGRAKAEIFSNPSTRVGIIGSTVPFDLSGFGSCPKVKVEPDAVLLPVAGKHNVANFLVARAIAREMGLSEEEIEAGKEKLQLPKQRFERIEKGGAILINDTYNAATTSVCAAMDALPEGKRRIAVLSAMVEMGKFSRVCHERVAEYALDRVDSLVLLGKDCLPMQEMWERKGRDVAYFEDRDALQGYLDKLIEPGDCVLFKGANSARMEEFIDGLFSHTLA